MNNTIQIGLRLDKSLVDKYKKKAKGLHMDYTQIIKLALGEWIK